MAQRGAAVASSPLEQEGEEDIEDGNVDEINAESALSWASSGPGPGHGASTAEVSVAKLAVDAEAPAG
ncbi:hypothetical protein OC835_003797 [Tilletia horrida]|nr:hypothetical protein OC835_003797 [Tilletia horrida]